VKDKVASFQPDGQIKKPVQPSRKNIPLSPTGKSPLQARPVPRRLKRRFAIVTDVARDAVDELVKVICPSAKAEYFFGRAGQVF